MAAPRFARSITTTLVALSIGLMLNVAIAWWVKEAHEHAPPPVYREIVTLEPTPHGWPAAAPADWPRPEREKFEEGLGWRTRELHAEWTYPDWIDHNAWDYEWGLPFRALSESNASGYESPFKHTDPLTVSPSTRAPVLVPVQSSTFGSITTPSFVNRWLDVRTLPIAPLWPGFALNTLLYAALAYALYQLPLALRRRIRRARNQCPRCAYALTGLAPGAPCPECGPRSWQGNMKGIGGK